MASQLCSSCGNDNPEDSNFCERCGARLGALGKSSETVCSSCGKENSEGSNFCNGCGAKLGASGESSETGPNPEPLAVAAEGNMVRSYRRRGVDPARASVYRQEETRWIELKSSGKQVVRPGRIPAAFMADLVEIDQNTVPQDTAAQTATPQNTAAQTATPQNTAIAAGPTRKGPSLVGHAMAIIGYIGLAVSTVILMLEVDWGPEVAIMLAPSILGILVSIISLMFKRVVMKVVPLILSLVAFAMVAVFFLLWIDQEVALVAPVVAAAGALLLFIGSFAVIAGRRIYSM